MFLFFLADRQGKAVAELERTMGAGEMMEWVAYFQLQDEKHKAAVIDKIADEAPIEEKAAKLRAFLSSLRPIK